MKLPRRNFFSLLLAPFLALPLSNKLSEIMSPAPITGALGTYRPVPLKLVQQSIGTFRTISEYYRDPTGKRVLLREYAVMGTTGTQQIGDIIDAVPERNRRIGDYNTRVVVGHVTRVATEAEFMSMHPACEKGLREYPDAPTLFRFPNYYIVQMYPKKA